MIPEITSALCVTRVPEIDMGLVAPAMTMLSTLMGIQLRADSTITSAASSINCSGLVGQALMEKMGLRLSSSELPATTLAISIMVFMQPGALPASALEDLIGQIKGLDKADVRKQIAEREGEGAEA